ncbi:hypothetical protein KCP77_19995 [Salmonella enterica subsp. enterica]|nr:hypothetical protein KCP77_19995 [Salmonella enterica subsp. enterica]
MKLNSLSAKDRCSIAGWRRGSIRHNNNRGSFELRRLAQIAARPAPLPLPESSCCPSR